MKLAQICIISTLLALALADKQSSVVVACILEKTDLVIHNNCNASAEVSPIVSCNDEIQATFQETDKTITTDELKTYKTCYEDLKAAAQANIDTGDQSCNSGHVDYYTNALPCFEDEAVDSSSIIKFGLLALISMIAL